MISMACVQTQADINNFVNAAKSKDWKTVNDMLTNNEIIDKKDSVSDFSPCA